MICYCALLKTAEENGRELRRTQTSQTVATDLVCLPVKILGTNSLHQDSTECKQEATELRLKVDNLCEVAVQRALLAHDDSALADPLQLIRGP